MAVDKNRFLSKSVVKIENEVDLLPTIKSTLGSSVIGDSAFSYATCRKHNHIAIISLALLVKANVNGTNINLTSLIPQPISIPSTKFMGQPLVIAENSNIVKGSFSISANQYLKIYANAYPDGIIYGQFVYFC